MRNLHPQTYEDFLSLAGEGTVVPVVKRVIADLLTPVAAYLKIERLSPYSFLLESVEGGEKVARYSFLGFDPEIIVRSRANKVTIERGSSKEETDEPMLAVLRRLSGRHIPVRFAELPPFVGGAVGYLSYDAVRWFEKLPDQARDELHLPDAVFLFGDVVSVFDNLTHTMKVVTHARGGADADRAYDAAVARLNAEVERLQKPLSWIE